jgi:hypothetical protein
MGLDFLVPLFGILIVLVPVLGLTTVLTLRLGGKPFVETLARELRGAGGNESTELRMQVAELTEQVEVLTAAVHQLRAAQSFDERLLKARDGESA